MKLFSKKSELIALYIITLNNTDSSKLLARLEPSHFLFPATKFAFQRFLYILRTKGDHLDWHSLCEDPALEDSYRELLNSLDTSSITSTSVDNVIRSLENYRAGRAINELVDFAKDKLKKAFDSEKLFDDIADLLMKARISTEDQKLYHVGSGNNTTSIINEILDQSKRPNYIPTGFATYDTLMGGLPDSGLVILAATTSSGKSMMANQLALNINDLGWDVCKVSLEMSADQELQRMISNLSEVSHSKIQHKRLTPSEIKRVKKTYKNLVQRGKRDEKRLTIVSPTEDLTLTQILMLVKPYNYKVIIIDYITLLKEKEKVDQWKYLSDVCREAKRFTLKSNTLIIMLAQLDEDLKIRYSKAIKEHCVTGDSYVNFNGSLVKVYDIFNPSLYQYEDDYKISTATGDRKILKYHRFEEKPIIKFKTELGYTIRVSETTPVLVYPFKWVKASSVVKGNFLALKLKQSFTNKYSKFDFEGVEYTFNESLAGILGTLFTRGIFDPERVLYFTTTDQKVYDNFIYCWNKFFDNKKLILKSKYESQNTIIYSVTCTEVSVLRLLSSLGLGRTDSLPSLLLHSPKSVVKSYIKAIGNSKIIVNPNEEVMVQLQLLFLKLGKLTKLMDSGPYSPIRHFSLDTNPNLLFGYTPCDLLNYVLRVFNLFLVPIASIENSVDKVFDFTVQGKHSLFPLSEGHFVANGLVVHNSDVCWMWNLTDADRDNGKFTVNQTKGRHQGLISFEVNMNSDCFKLTDGGVSMMDSDSSSDSENDDNEVSDMSNLMS